MNDNKKNPIKENVKALVLSGGGVKGTFQFGAVDYLLKHVLEEEEKFKIITGVSAGALCGSMLAAGRFEEGKAIWQDQIDTGVKAFSQRYPTWFLALFAVLPGAAFYFLLKHAKSIFRNKKLRQVLADNLGNLPNSLVQNDTHLRVGVVDYQIGDYQSIDPAGLGSNEKVVDAVLASTSIPLAFPAVKIKDNQAFDGGVINVTPFKDVFEITRTDEFQSKYNLESIYAVMCSPLAEKQTEKEYKGLIDIGLRTMDLLLMEIYRNDLRVFEKTNALVMLRKELENANAAQAQEILKKIKDQTSVDIKIRNTVKSHVIAPDPLLWLDYVNSDVYPADLEKPEPLGSDPVKAFWRDWPDTLSKDKNKLRACFNFGWYMAREVTSPKNP